MDAKVKSLIVLAVMMLSVGPMVYFFGQNQEENSGVTPESELNYTTAGITTLGEIKSLEDYLIYNGVSMYDNPDYPNKILNETLKLKDYKLTYGLNDGGEGYKYSIKIPINPKENLEELGFLMSYNLAPFFTETKFIPYRLGTVKLPEKVALKLPDETEKQTEIGGTYTLAARYWQKTGNMATVHCPYMRFEKETYKFIENEEFCYDISETDEYGLKTSVLDELAEQNAVLDLSADRIKGLYYEYNENEKVTTEKIFEELSAWYSSMTMTVRREDNKIKLDLAYVNEDASVTQVQERMQKLGLKQTDAFKEVIVTLPYEIRIGATKYTTLYRGMQRAKAKLGTKESDIKKFNIYIKAKYGQILTMRIEEVGLSSGAS